MQSSFPQKVLFLAVEPNILWAGDSLSGLIFLVKKKYTGESAVISMRIPKDMLADIDHVAKATGRTRNEIMTMALEFSLEHMRITPTENEIVREIMKHGDHQV